jgi:excisionase family DNA binding protein
MINENIDNKRYLNLKEMAGLLGKSSDYVRRMAQKRIIPCIKLPGQDRIFEKEKVIAALARFEVKEVGR